ncbi:asparaginase [Aestuariibius sp. HNIBRBA575]|uniref:asparaginase n=1 Tax=Aestuariibius sp. HNIBRBA575 TaxID=3233343 RepID=UPI0034A3AC26
MAGDTTLVELWRGGILESVHRGHAVICDAKGDVIASLGDPNAVIFPRSSCKMIQALPLVESGLTLSDEQLALSCASHQGAAIHTDRVTAWLNELGLAEADLRCGAQVPADKDAKFGLIRAHQEPCQIHNNCSGKHAGFLTLNQHIGGGADYVDVDHPLQQMVRDAFEGVTGETSPGFGIDGCSAPNFATSVTGLARAMAQFASAGQRSDARAEAQQRLTAAMMKHPDLVAGETRACTELMRAMNGLAAIKTGAEAVFVAIVPGRGFGIALKVTDGGTRGAEAAIAALLSKIGVLDENHPMALKRSHGPLRNWRGIEVGEMRLAAPLAELTI